MKVTIIYKHNLDNFDSFMKTLKSLIFAFASCMRALWEVLEIDIEEVLKVEIERENVIYRKALFRCLDVDILNMLRSRLRFSISDIA